MKKNDVILIGVILIVAAVGLIFLSLNKKSGDKVIVTVDGVLYQEYSLNEDISVEIEGVGGNNHLVIKDGYADVDDASCPDKLCVKQNRISKNGEMIVCLPNKVIVKIESSNEAEVDGVAN